jgi:hypothetical protein
MADDGDAKLLQVIRGKVQKNLAVDFVVAKCSLVLSKAESSQPPPDVHRLLRTGLAKLWSN